MSTVHSDEEDDENHDDAITDGEDSSTFSAEVESGVRKIEAISQTWSKWGLIFAYIGILLMAFCTSLESQTTWTLAIYATSTFRTHALVATVLVIQGVILSCVKPPIAKIANVFGRLEAFSVAVFLYVIGYIQQAASNNVRTYAAAQIFYSCGSAALQILQQIFIADTSDLLNRAFWSTLPDLPFLVTVWIGPIIGASILSHTSWRWGYGIWAIALPFAFLPFALSLHMNAKRAAEKGLKTPSIFEGQSFGSALKLLWFELDLCGLLLLCTGLSLILIPLTIAASANGGWRNASIIAMLIVGCLCIILFPFWETNKRFAPKPLLTLRLLKERTVTAGGFLAFFYFMAFYLSVQPYFNSYLQVVQFRSVAAAGHITQIFSFSATITSITISLFIKYTKHYKYFVVAGSCLYMLGIGLMIRYRTADASTVQVVAVQIAVGVGGGMLHGPAQLGVQAAATHQEVAIATAVFLTLLELGGAVGSAISGAVWTHNVLKKLQLYLPPADKGDATIIYGSIEIALSYARGSAQRVAINRAYQETMNILLRIAIYVCLPLIPLALLMKNYKLDQMDQGVKGRVFGASRLVADPNPTAEHYSRVPSEDDSHDSSKAR